MYARTITLEVRPSMLDQLLQIFNEQVFPVTQQYEGFVNAMLLVDRTKGKVVSVTLWETEATMRADETGKNLQGRIAEVSRYFTSVMITERYEVAHHITAKSETKDEG